MNNTNIKELDNSLSIERIFTIVIFIAVLVTAFICLFKFFLYKDITDLKHGLYSIFAAIISGLLTLIFQDIHKKQTPFTKSVIIKLQCMAVITMLAGVMPSVISKCVSMMLEHTNSITFNLSLGSETTFILLIGTIIGIVSEIFKYGAKLQEDIDSIA